MKIGAECMLHYPIHHPSTIKREQNDSILKASNIVNIVNGILSAMPRSILRISTWNVNLVLEPDVQTYGKPAGNVLLFFFERNYRRFYIFSDRWYRSCLSKQQQQQQQTQAGFPVVLSVHKKHRIKNHFQIGNVERGKHGQSTALQATSWLAQPDYWYKKYRVLEFAGYHILI